jgi:hypothetical protein
MQKRMVSCVPAISVSVFAAMLALDPGGSLAAGNCVAQPDRAPAPGGHWYYHLDRTNNRKCWYLMEPAGSPPPAETLQPQSLPQAVQQPPSFSFFSLPTSFAPVSLPASQPDSVIRDARGMPIAQPEEPNIDDAVRPKPRRHVDARPAPGAKSDRQGSPRPGKELADQPHSTPPDQAERDALFQEFLRWRERQ